MAKNGRIIPDELTPGRLKVNDFVMVSCESISTEFLLDFNEKEKLRRFNLSSVECEICMNLKRGEQCSKLTCGHVFCQECLNRYFECLISDGLVLLEVYFSRSNISHSL